MMVDEFQKDLIEKFFSELPGVSQSMLHDIAARLLRPTEESALDVNPALMQAAG
jgi:hypothetical protein